MKKIMQPTPVQWPKLTQEQKRQQKSQMREFDRFLKANKKWMSRKRHPSDNRRLVAA